MKKKKELHLNLADLNFAETWAGVDKAEPLKRVFVRPIASKPAPEYINHQARFKSLKRAKKLKKTLKSPL